MLIQNTKEQLKSNYNNSIIDYKMGKISFIKLEEIYEDMFWKWYDYKRENEYTLLKDDMNEAQKKYGEYVTLKSVNMEDFDLIDPNDIR